MGAEYVWLGGTNISFLLFVTSIDSKSNEMTGEQKICRFVFSTRIRGSEEHTKLCT